jgi:hypothetical protein
MDAVVSGYEKRSFSKARHSIALTVRRQACCIYYGTMKLNSKTRLSLVLLSTWLPCAAAATIFGSPKPSSSRSTTKVSAYVAKPSSRHWMSPARSSSERTSLDTTIIKRLRGGSVDPKEIVAGSNGWLMSLGSPAALVAGAVLASLYELNRNDSLDLEEYKDSKLVIFGKKCSKLLLVSAFAMELICIFVIMVTGTGKSMYIESIIASRTALDLVYYS